MVRRLIAAALLLLAVSAPVLAQSPYPPGPPPPVPGLPDQTRVTSYTITASTCACAVGFQLYGDSTDYQNWVEVWVNGVNEPYNDSTYGWTITSPTGSLATISRPITDGVLTFNNVQTGTVLIVGAQRPRRTAEFAENQGITARALNQWFNTVVAMLREVWDKTSDLSGRGLFFAPGNITGPMPQPSQCANDLLGFDASGKNPVCYAPTGTQPVVRAIFTGAANFYVDVANGHNTPTCGLSTGASACQSMPFAYARLQDSYDLAGNTITMQLATGTGYAPLTATGRLVGQASPLIIQGNTGNQDSVVVDGGGTATSCVAAVAGAWLQVQYVKVQNCINQLAAFEQHGLLSFQDVDFGAPVASGIDVYASRQSYVEVIGCGNTISAGGFSNFIQVSHQGNFRSAEICATPFVLNTNITLSTGAWAYASSQGDITFTGYTGSAFNLNGHTVTGRQFIADSDGMFQDLNNSTGASMTPNFFPGTATTGICIGDCQIDQPAHVAPTLTGCGGGSPTIAGNDYYGQVTEGTSTAACSIVFGSTFSGAPYCVIAWIGGAPAGSAGNVNITSSVAGFGVSHSSASGASFYYQCKGF